MQVTKAKRSQLKLAMAMVGASGSGKTRKALTVATGLMKHKYPKATKEEIANKIGVVDAEKRSSEYYSNVSFNDNAPIEVGEFWKVDLNPPFTAKRYKDAVDLLKKQGCEVIIIDSFSHSWFAEGGVLDLQQDAGGTFQAWGSKPVKGALDTLFALIRDPQVHMIHTLRAEEDLRIEPDPTSKSGIAVKKYGMKAIMKKEAVFEYDIVLRLDSDHRCHIDKDRTVLFESKGNGSIITVEDGIALGQWLDEGIPIEEVNEQRLKQLQADISDLLVNDEKIIQKYEKYAEMYKKKNQKDLDILAFDLPALTNIYNYLVK